MNTLYGCLLVSLLALSAPAQILRYDLTGQPSSGTLNESVSATTVSPGLAGGLLVRGPGIVAAGLGNGFSGNNWNNPGTLTGLTSASLANAVTTGDFFEFGFSVNTDYLASLATFNVSLRRSAIAAPMNYQLQYSFDGFATPGTQIATFKYLGRSSGTAPTTVEPYSWMTADVAGQNNGNPISTIDLAGISALQNIIGGSTVTFRLYGWGDDAVAGAADSNTVALGRIDGPTFGGTVVMVPEPSSLTLLGLGLCGLLVFRRR